MPCKVCIQLEEAVARMLQDTRCSFTHDSAKAKAGSLQISRRRLDPLEVQRPVKIVPSTLNGAHGVVSAIHWLADFDSIISFNC